ncbi:hypothetical protein F52700_9682 [Fusarium sp. NRRL 52700]|nr:hypothetical protein F52700_9682 [Fusarium sp. NRRL 52700]
MHSDYDITNLMYGAQTAAELDFYQGEPKPRLEPLLLDTVMQGRPPASNCRLLQMPSENLAKIVSFIAQDNKALQQLVLVNSDCCGFSRACQFSELKFDCSPNKIKLLLQLAKGTIEGRTGPSILDCVRKFTFKPDPYQVRAVHSNVWRRFRDDSDDEYEGTAEVKEQGAEIFKQIQHTVALNLKAMRNLETLVWDCNFSVDKDGFLLLLCSTAHDLLINDTLIAENFSLGPPLTPPSWPLRSLVLMNLRLVGSSDQEHIHIGQGEPLRPNLSNDFFKSLFQLCSPTLESLVWESWNPGTWKPLSLGIGPKSFPKLRHLRIMPGRDAIDEASFDSLLYAPLKSLEPRHSSFRLFEHLIRSHIEEPYRDLEELVVKLGQNKDSGYDKDHFHILPESLMTICELTTLQQLGLRCADMEPEFDSYEDYIEETYPIWLIDHGKLQARLQNLKNLKLLVIRGDTYPPRANEIFGHPSYYKSHYGNEEDFQTAKDHPELAPFVQSRHEISLAWQHAHLYRMLEYARSYRKVLPKLEWILCGRRPMKFMENAQGVVQPHPVGNELDECKTFIGRVFGLASEVEIAHLID